MTLTCSRCPHEAQAVGLLAAHLVDAHLVDAFEALKEARRVEAGTPRSPTTAAFGTIAELAAALGVRNIKDLPGCWEHRVDDLWWFAINAHAGPVKCSGGILAPLEVPPGHCYLEYNGWPAGCFTPWGGEIAAGEAFSLRVTDGSIPARAE